MRFLKITEVKWVTCTRTGSEWNGSWLWWPAKSEEAGSPPDGKITGPWPEARLLILWQWYGRKPVGMTIDTRWLQEQYFRLAGKEPHGRAQDSWLRNGSECSCSSAKERREWGGNRKWGAPGIRLKTYLVIFSLLLKCISCDFPFLGWSTLRETSKTHFQKWGLDLLCAFREYTLSVCLGPGIVWDSANTGETKTDEFLVLMKLSFLLKKTDDKTKHVSWGLWPWAHTVCQVGTLDIRGR